MELPNRRNGRDYIEPNSPMEYPGAPLMSPMCSFGFRAFPVNMSMAVMSSILGARVIKNHGNINLGVITPQEYPDKSMMPEN